MQFIDGELYNEPTRNVHINSLLEIVRGLTRENFQVVEAVVKLERKWWKKSSTYPVYWVYLYVGGDEPWQIIDISYSAGESDEGSGSSAECVISYLQGVLTGFTAACAGDDSF
jgi:hypothetical protein